MASLSLLERFGSVFWYFGHRVSFGPNVRAGAADDDLVPMPNSFSRIFGMLGSFVMSPVYAFFDIVNGQEPMHYELTSSKNLDEVEVPNRKRQIGNSGTFWTGFTATLLFIVSVPLAVIGVAFKSIAMIFSPNMVEMVGNVQKAKARKELRDTHRYFQNQIETLSDDVEFLRQQVVQQRAQIEEMELAREQLDYQFSAEQARLREHAEEVDAQKAELEAQIARLTSANDNLRSMAERGSRELGARGEQSVLLIRQLREELEQARALVRQTNQDARVRVDDVSSRARETEEQLRGTLAEKELEVQRLQGELRQQSIVLQASREQEELIGQLRLRISVFERQAEANAAALQEQEVLNGRLKAELEALSARRDSLEPVSEEHDFVSEVDTLVGEEAALETAAEEEENALAVTSSADSMSAMQAVMHATGLDVNEHDETPDTHEGEPEAAHDAELLEDADSMSGMQAVMQATGLDVSEHDETPDTHEGGPEATLDAELLEDADSMSGMQAVMQATGLDVSEHDETPDAPEGETPQASTNTWTGRVAGLLNRLPVQRLRATNLAHRFGMGVTVDPENINDFDAQGRTVLHNAIINQNPGLVIRALDAGADITLRTREGFNVFHLAAQHPCVAVVEALRRDEKDLSVQYERIRAKVNGKESMEEGVLPLIREYWSAQEQMNQLISRNHDLLIQTVNANGGELTPVQLAIKNPKAHEVIAKLVHVYHVPHLPNPINTTEDLESDLSDLGEEENGVFKVESSEAGSFNGMNPELLKEKLSVRGAVGSSILQQALRHKNKKAFEAIYVMHPEPAAALRLQDEDEDDIFYDLFESTQEEFDELVDTILTIDGENADEVANTMAELLVQNMLKDTDMSRVSFLKLIETINKISPSAFQSVLGQLSGKDLESFVEQLLSYSSTDVDDEPSDIIYTLLGLDEQLVDFESLLSTGNEKTFAQLLLTTENPEVVETLMEIGVSPDFIVPIKHDINERFIDLVAKTARTFDVITDYFDRVFAGKRRDEIASILHSKSHSAIKSAIESENWAFLKALYERGRRIVREIAKANPEETGYILGLEEAIKSENALLTGILVGNTEKYPLVAFNTPDMNGQTLLQKLSRKAGPREFMFALNGLQLSVDELKELFPADSDVRKSMSSSCRAQLLKLTNEVHEGLVEGTMFTPMRNASLSRPASRNRTELSEGSDADSDLDVRRETLRS